MTCLKEGDKAPNFSVLNQDDKLLTLDTYKGKKLILCVGLFENHKLNEDPCSHQDKARKDNHLYLHT